METRWGISEGLGARGARGNINHFLAQSFPLIQFYPIAMSMQHAYGLNRDGDGSLNALFPHSAALCGVHRYPGLTLHS